MLAACSRAVRMCGWRGMCTNPNAAAGFSFPAPRSLNDIAKVELLQAEVPDRVKKIWLQHHEKAQHAVASTLDAAQYQLMMPRMHESPMFVLPVQREGGHFVLLSQVQDRHCLFTYLEDFKRNPATAQPYMTVTVFDDLVETKGLALVRADFGANLTRQECTRLVTLLGQLYASDKLYEWARRFNHQPSAFDWEKCMNDFSS